MTISSSNGNHSINKPALQSVAEQPGMFVFLVGMVISLFLGFVIRGLIAEQTIKSRVQEVIQTTEYAKNIKIGRAWIRLSSGIFPDLSLVLSQVHFESENACWGGPSADIQEVRFPLSVYSLIVGDSPVDRAEIDEMTLLLRKDPKSCSQLKENEASAEGRSTPVPALVTTSVPAPKELVAEVIAKNKLPFRRIGIETLKVNYLPIPFSSFNFFNLDVALLSAAPLILNVQTKLEINGETLSGEYSSHSALQVHYDESAKKNARLEWVGSWREGRYEIQGDFERETKKYNLAVSLRYLPLSQIFPVLKKYKIMTSDFNGKQTWISASAKSSGFWTGMAAAPWSFREVKLEGDIGELRTEEIHFQSLEPIKFEPVRFRLKNMNIDAVLAFLGKTHPSQALSKTGIFNGNLDFKNPDDITLSGDHAGLEFIFSNKGIRQHQEIKLMKVFFRLNDNQWVGQVSDFKLNGGNLDGRVELKASKGWDDLTLSARLKDLKLSPEVENLITQGGSLSGVSGEVDFRFYKGALKHLSGAARGSQWKIEDISFYEPLLQFKEMRGGEFGVQFQLKGMESYLDWKTSTAENHGSAVQYLSLLGDSGRELFGDHLVLQNISGKFQTHALTDFYWSELHGSSADSSIAFISSSGGWDSQNKLSGELKIGTPKRTIKWIIRGTRDTPQLSKE